jgi:hypothetical protein
MFNPSCSDDAMVLSDRSPRLIVVETTVDNDVGAAASMSYLVLLGVS